MTTDADLDGRNALPALPWLCLYAVENRGAKKGTVPVVTNGGFGDTTGTVPFGEERQVAPSLIGFHDQRQVGSVLTRLSGP
jgi:hypothetical protein